MTPILDSAEYRVVLSWGEEPSDLDSNLTGILYGKYTNIYYSTPIMVDEDDIVALLDIDDISSYGPETITFKLKDSNDTVSYYVTDYSNRNNYESYELSFSNAKVCLYKGNSLLRTYYVPINKQGTIWEVFSIKDGVLSTQNIIK